MALAVLVPPLVLIVFVGWPTHAVQWMILLLLLGFCGLPGALAVRSVGRRLAARYAQSPTAAVDHDPRTRTLRSSGLVVFPARGGDDPVRRSIPVPIDLYEDDDEEEAEKFFASLGESDDGPLQVDWSAGVGDDAGPLQWDRDVVAPDSSVQSVPVLEEPVPVLDELVPVLEEPVPVLELSDLDQQSEEAGGVAEFESTVSIEPLHVCLADSSYKVQQTALSLIKLHGADVILGRNLHPFLGGGSGLELISLSLVTDVIRLIEIGMGSKKPTDEVLDVLSPLVDSFMVAMTMLGRREYQAFLDPTSERMYGFCRAHSQDARAFGGASMTTCWAGLQICENAARADRSRLPLDEYTVFLQTAVEALALVKVLDPATEPTLPFLMSRIERTWSEIDPAKLSNHGDDNTSWTETSSD